MRYGEDGKVVDSSISMCSVTRHVGDWGRLETNEQSGRFPEIYTKQGIVGIVNFMLYFR